MKYFGSLLVIALVLLLAVPGCSSLPYADVLSSLTSIPGVSETQAIAGAGSMLGLASAKLPAADYAKVANSIPGADALVKEAGKLTGLTSFGSLTDVTNALGKLGVTPDQVMKMGSSLADYAGKTGGAEVTSMLTGLLK